MARQPQTKTSEELVENKEVKVTTEQTFTKEEMINLAKEMAKELLKEELSKIQETTVKKKSAMDLNVLIKIKSNVDGQLIWSSTKTSTRINLLLKGSGDEDWITVAEAKDIARWSQLFKNGLVSICEVDSDDYTLEDIIQFLGLNRIYDSNVIAPSRIESILTKEDIGFEKFNELLTNSEEIGETILEMAYKLKQQGKIKETYKLDALRAKVAFKNRYSF